MKWEAPRTNKTVPELSQDWEAPTGSEAGWGTSRRIFCINFYIVIAQITAPGDTRT
jgi:hypothetical protein